MPNDENVTQLLTRHARIATEDIQAPDSWLNTVPARANARRRRARWATATVATFAVSGIAAAIVIPLARAENDQRTTPKHSTQLAAYNFALTSPAAGSVSDQLPCITGTPPRQPGSSAALSVGGTERGTTCLLVQGRRDAALPPDARRVPGHGGRVYLAPPASGYRLGYRTYDNPADGSPLILQIAVGQAVPSTRLIAVLDSVGLVPRGH